MDQLKLGGFPPLIKIQIKSKIKIDKTQTELKPQYFSQIPRQNINIREILTNKTTLFEDTQEDKLEEVNYIDSTL
ncbi:hypothetical protein crov293 [Cafeteria roenbergensis virus]|uniref:Uncharacterized protein n=1 Tax=Cafeteria roenbergensis virus (strain BV-PW1) TaxID=693272 RepID=E3T563_CROVB|nr:hypothetical protein crov293 [Cafeteria roenbergensis virus BV-PW1]ADO67326.1 hypothetical protein crov293 [Cafeteria roenbergensis virus BV-PW1]